MTDESEPFDGYLCFAIYASGMAFNRIYSRLLEKYDLTYPQYLVLTVLWKHGEMSIGQIGARISLDSNTLTPMLKRLEGKSLITRRRDAHDERRVLVQLTEKASRIRHHSDNVTSCIVDAIGLSTDELKKLTSSMHTLRLRLEDYADRETGSDPCPCGAKPGDRSTGIKTV